MLSWHTGGNTKSSHNAVCLFSVLTAHHIGRSKLLAESSGCPDWQAGVAGSFVASRKLGRKVSEKGWPDTVAGQHNANRPKYGPPCFCSNLEHPGDRERPALLSPLRFVQWTYLLYKGDRSLEPFLPQRVYSKPCLPVHRIQMVVFDFSLSAVSSFCPPFLKFKAVYKGKDNTRILDHRLCDNRPQQCIGFMGQLDVLYRGNQIACAADFFFQIVFALLLQYRVFYFRQLLLYAIVLGNKKGRVNTASRQQATKCVTLREEIGHLQLQAGSARCGY